MLRSLLRLVVLGLLLAGVASGATCSEISECGTCKDAGGSCTWCWDANQRGSCQDTTDTRGQCISGTPDAQAGDVCRPPPLDPPQCSSALQCSECTKIDGCGWCTAEGGQNGVCETLSDGRCPKGETFPDDGKCDVPPPPSCSDKAACGECAEADGCSWCWTSFGQAATGSCVSAESGTSCPNRDQGSCQAPPDCSKLPCGECSQTPGCGFCWSDGRGQCTNLVQRDQCPNSGVIDRGECKDPSPSPPEPERPCGNSTSCAECGALESCAWCWSGTGSSASGYCASSSGDVCGELPRDQGQCTAPPEEEEEDCSAAASCGDCGRLTTCAWCWQGFGPSAPGVCSPKDPASGLPASCPAAAVDAGSCAAPPTPCGERSSCRECGVEEEGMHCGWCWDQDGRTGKCVETAPGTAARCLAPTAADSGSCAAPKPCGEHRDCEGCGADDRCNWCQAATPTVGSACTFKLTSSGAPAYCPKDTRLVDKCTSGNSTGPGTECDRHTTCGPCADSGCVWCPSSIAGTPGSCKAPTDACPTGVEPIRESSDFCPLPCEERKDCGGCTSEAGGVLCTWCYSSYEQGSCKRGRSAAGVCAPQFEAVKYETCPKPDPCLNNDCAITEFCRPNAADADPSYSCLPKCSNKTCPEGFQCEVDGETGRVNCVPSEPVDEWSCDKADSCEACLANVKDGLRCEWYPPSTSSAGVGSCRPHSNEESPVIVRDIEKCVVNPCESLTCDADKTCLVSSTDPTRAFCVPKCDLHQCPLNHKCALDPTTGRPFCKPDDSTPTPQPTTPCEQRTSCGQCLLGQIAEAGNACGWCPYPSGGGFCYANSTASAAEQRCASLGSRLRWLAASCPRDWCANYECPAGHVCQNTADGPKCVSKCHGFPCAFGTRCQIDASTGEPACVDPCASLTCDTAQRCTLNSFGQAVCVDRCFGRCDAASGAVCTVEDSADRGVCTCPDGKVLERVPSSTSADDYFFKCVDKPVDVTCDGYVCPAPDQTCAVRTIRVYDPATNSSREAKTIECVCPEGKTLSVDPESNRPRCIDSVCSDDTCGANEECRVLTGRNPDGTTWTKPECICREGYYRDRTGACRPVTELPCEDDLVRDTVTNRCVKPCPDGSSPAGNVCPTVCPEPLVPAPATSAYAGRCGVYCHDEKRTFAPSYSMCPCVHTAPADVPATQYTLCKCPEDQVRDPVDRTCKPCPGNAKPVDGRCPTEAPECPFGQVWVEAVRRCQVVCPTSTADVPVYADYLERCPFPDCEKPLVLDRGLRKCVDPCPDGSVPYNGRCPIVCDSTLSAYECCIKKGGTDCVKPCDVGYERTATGECVKSCPNGEVVNAEGECASPECENFGVWDPTAEVCYWVCPDRRRVKSPAECCQEPARFDVRRGVCRCPNGQIQLLSSDGKWLPCPVACDPNNLDASVASASADVSCPCPAPTRRDPVSRRCVCPDGRSPFEGGCSPTQQCPRGLVMKDGMCLCPDGSRPSDDLKCRCDPSRTEECPLTPFNCEGREESHPPCRCISEKLRSGSGATAVYWRDDPVCRTSDVPTPEFCRRNPTPRCFCVLHPDAEECTRPSPCIEDPNSEECKETEECSDLATCDRAETFCRKNPTHEKCKCVLNPKECSYDNEVRNPADCSDAEKKDPTNVICYCRHHLADRRCYNSKGEIVTDRNTPGDAPAVSTDPRPRCQEDASRCDSEASPVTGPGSRQTGHALRVRQRGADDTAVTTDVRVNGTEMSVRRSGTGGSSEHRARAEVGLRMALEAAVEFIDADGDCRFSEGDSVLQRISLARGVTWTAEATESMAGAAGGKFYTVTVTEPSKRFVLSFVISADKYTIGDRTIPADSARLMFEVKFPWSSTRSKLALVFRLVVPSGLTVSLPDISKPGVLAVRDASSGASRGSVDNDDFARIGAAQVSVVLSPPVASDEDADGKAFTIFACVDAIGAPNVIVYDPIVSAAEYNPPAPDTISASSAVAPSAAAVLAAAILAAGAVLNV